MCFESLSDSHRPASTEIFLDTSIHCSALKGDSFRERIDAVLRLFQWKSTSTYTKVEFGNVVLSCAQYYLRKLTELGSLARVKEFIGNVLPHDFHGKYVTWAFNLLERHYGRNDAECTERAVLHLRRLMKTGIALVERGCDKPLANGTDCYWAAKGVHKRRDGTLEWNPPRCDRTRKRCRLDEFFRENRSVFLRIKAAIDEMPDDNEKTRQLRDFSEVIGQASRDPGALLDYKKGCSRLADAIIAVDSRDYKSMFSQNAAESKTLTRVLGQAFYYLPANPDRWVQVRSADGIDAEREST